MTERLDPSRLYIHGVGSRGEGMTLEFAPRFADDCVHLNYEPDGEATEQTSAFFQSRGVRETTFPVAIADQDGETTVNINFDPFTSSTLPPNPDYATFYGRYDPPNGDYLMGTTCALARRITAPAARLDTICARHGLGLDFASIDIQGADLDALRSAGALVETDLLAFMIEIEFHPLYQNQALAEDIFAYARRHGFLMIRMFPHPPGSLFRGPIGWRGSAITVSCDALFFKDPRRIVSDHPAPRRSLLKLAFLALRYDNIEYALDCLETARSLPDAAGDERLAERGYVRFLSELAALYASTEGVQPPSFDDLFSIGESLARFAPGGDVHAYDPAKARRRYFAKTDPATFRRRFPELVAMAATPLETLLTDNGFGGAAAMARANRKRQCWTTAVILGLTPRDALPDAPLDPNALIEALDRALQDDAQQEKGHEQSGAGT